MLTASQVAFLRWIAEVTTGTQPKPFTILGVEHTGSVTPRQARTLIEIARKYERPPDPTEMPKIRLSNVDLLITVLEMKEERYLLWPYLTEADCARFEAFLGVEQRSREVSPMMPRRTPPRRGGSTPPGEA
jgi:hypothetical protein